MNVIEGVVKNGRIVPTTAVTLREGSRAIITLVDRGDNDFWLSASEESAASVWENSDDDAYAELLEK